MKKEKKKRRKQKGVSLWQDFKAFINRGNVVDMAVGVVVGGAFGAIVTAVVNVLLSLCTWAVPGGLKGLITVLPAVNEAQQGVAGIGQSFAASEIADCTEILAASQGQTIDSANFAQWENILLGKYTLRGTTYYYNASAIIDWGAIINAAISFIIIAVVLFTIIKVFQFLRKRRALVNERIKEEYYRKHPEERPVPQEPGKPTPTEIELLTDIRDALKAKSAT